jgi:hypothetical protein
MVLVLYAFEEFSTDPDGKYVRTLHSKAFEIPVDEHGNPTPLAMDMAISVALGEVNGEKARIIATIGTLPAQTETATSEATMTGGGGA